MSQIQVDTTPITKNFQCYPDSPAAQTLNAFKEKLIAKLKDIIVIHNEIDERIRGKGKSNTSDEDLRSECKRLYNGLKMENKITVPYVSLSYALSKYIISKPEETFPEEVMKCRSLNILHAAGNINDQSLKQIGYGFNTTTSLITLFLITYGQESINDKYSNLFASFRNAIAHHQYSIHNKSIAFWNINKDKCTTWAACFELEDIYLLGYLIQMLEKRGVVVDSLGN